MDTMNNKRYDETTKFQVNYSMLQRAAKLKYFKACYKHYLNDHVRSRFANVEAPEWEIAKFLPTAAVEKSAKSNIDKDSRMKING